MFDSPSSTPTSSPTPPPITPPVAPGVPPLVPSPKEPEDMFAGVDKVTPPSTPKPAPLAAPVVPPRRRGKVVLAVSLALIIVVAWGGVAYWYFILRDSTGSFLPPASPTSTASAVVATTPEPIIETPPVTQNPDAQNLANPVTSTPAGTTIPLPIIEGTSSTTGEVTSTNVGVVSGAVVSKGIDTDNDGLTDAEESTLGTSLTSADSDADGYKDLAELQSGYDPTRPSMKIAGSPAFRLALIGDAWKTYLPSKWTLGSDTVVAGDYVIKTGEPASFAIHIANKPQALTFFAWLATNEPTVDPATLQQVTTKQGYVGWASADGMTTYLVLDSSIVVVRYQLGSAKSDDFRTTYDWLIQSLTTK